MIAFFARHAYGFVTALFMAGAVYFGVYQSEGVLLAAAYTIAIAATYATSYAAIEAHAKAKFSQREKT